MYFLQMKTVFTSSFHWKGCSAVWDADDPQVPLQTRILERGPPYFQGSGVTTEPTEMLKRSSRKREISSKSDFFVFPLPLGFLQSLKQGWLQLVLKRNCSWE